MTDIWRFTFLFLSFALMCVSGTARGDETIQSVDKIVEIVNSELLRSSREAKLDQPDIDVALPDGRLRLKHCPESQLHAKVPNTARFPGLISVEVTCEAEHRWKIYVQATLATRISVPVPRWNIPRSQVIAQADLEFRELTLVEPLIGIIDRMELAVGKISTRFLNAGEPIRTSQLSSPLLVKRGQAVTIRYQVGQLELSAGGTAQADGQQGDWIRVRGNSGSLVEGRVSADGSVLVAGEN